MSHRHLQIQFGFDFEGYAAVFIHNLPPPPSQSSKHTQTSHTFYHPGLQLPAELYAIFFYFIFCQDWVKLCRGGDADLISSHVGPNTQSWF